MNTTPNNFPPYVGNSLQACEGGHVTLRSEGLRYGPCPTCQRHETASEAVIRANQKRVEKIEADKERYRTRNKRSKNAKG